MNGWVFIWNSVDRRTKELRNRGGKLIEKLWRAHVFLNKKERVRLELKMLEDLPPVLRRQAGDTPRPALIQKEVAHAA